MQELNERRVKERAQSNFWTDPFVYFIAFLTSAAIYIDSLKPNGFVNQITASLRNIVQDQGLFGILTFHVAYMVNFLGLYFVWIVYRRMVRDECTIFTAITLTIEESVKWAYNSTMDVLCCRICKQPSQEEEADKKEEDEFFQQENQSEEANEDDRRED